MVVLKLLRSSVLPVPEAQFHVPETGLLDKVRFLAGSSRLTDGMSRSVAGSARMSEAIEIKIRAKIPKAKIVTIDMTIIIIKRAPFFFLGCCEVSAS